MANAPKEPGPIHPYFAGNLRYWRSQKRMSVEDLAKSTGLAKRTIYAYEARLANPRYISACKIAKALGIRVDLIWDHQPPPDHLSELPH